MRIAIASGKGGTGKTTVATNLAWVAAGLGHTVAYFDCDVEEPDGHLFLHPTIHHQSPIEKLRPIVQPSRCTGCGRCSQVCQYGAIASLGSQILIFAELCHSCGGCVLVCPSHALTEVPQSIGQLRIGEAGPIRFVEGRLHVGEAISSPAIRAVNKVALSVEWIFIDCPPGTSCPVIESVRSSDLLLLVTEPTPFGLHDLQMAVEMARMLGLTFGVVVNRSDVGDREVWHYCARQAIPILAEIPDDRAVAEAYCRGQLAAETVPEFAKRIRLLWETVKLYAARLKKGSAGERSAGLSEYSSPHSGTTAHQIRNR